MRRIAEALRNQGASPNELEALEAYPADLTGFWAQCHDPVLLLKVGGAAGIDPRYSIAVAIDLASSVQGYIGQDEPRPAKALDAAKRWLHGEATADELTDVAQGGEDAADNYRAARKGVDKAQRRVFRAAAYAAFAAAKAALTARDAALTTELEYDDTYTFDDAWNGARIACADQAAAVAEDVVEAAVSATAARVTQETGSDIAGGAAAHEARPAAQKWAADLVRRRVDVGIVVQSADAILGRL